MANGLDPWKVAWSCLMAVCILCVSIVGYNFAQDAKTCDKQDASIARLEKEKVDASDYQKDS